MNTNDLKIFEAVASQGSFTKAAAAMFTVQSNVTARIKSLEDEFGTKLFTRNSRKVELTPGGQTLMHYCKQIAHLVEEAKTTLQSSNVVSGHLKIGCIETTMALKVPKILKDFKDAYPGVQLEFTSENRSTLINDVLNYRIDAAFVSAPVISKELDQLQVRTEQLVILRAASGPKLEDLIATQPLTIVVFGEGCIFRSRLESWLSYKSVVHYNCIVLNSIEGVINFVEAGLGISILPAEVVESYYSGRQLKQHALNKELGTMNTVLVFRKEMEFRALTAFLEMYR
jgi:DNA-binding transcriptional LysR family regulator